MVANILFSLGLSFIVLLPIGIKWQLEKKIVISTAIFLGIGNYLIFSSWHEGLSYFKLGFFHLSTLVIISSLLILWRFYRDPERIPPPGDGIIISPADGKIIYVRRFEGREIPYSEKGGKKFMLDDFVTSNLLPNGGYDIGISMNYLDVHVNRSPISGKICCLKHIKGLFLSLRKKEAIIQNERVLTIIENSRIKIGVVQIASRLVRKITPYLTPDSEVMVGQRIGAIRFGSQVDVILPDISSLKILVDEGEKVLAGLTVIAKI